MPLTVATARNDRVRVDMLVGGAVVVYDTLDVVDALGYVVADDEAAEGLDEMNELGQINLLAEELHTMRHRAEAGYYRKAAPSRLLLTEFEEVEWELTPADPDDPDAFPAVLFPYD